MPFPLGQQINRPLFPIISRIFETASSFNHRVLKSIGV